MKTCVKCGVEKDDSEFYKHHRSCKQCISEYNKQYTNKNYDKKLEYNKNRYHAIKSGTWKTMDKLDPEEIRKRNLEEAKKRYRNETPEQREIRLKKKREQAKLKRKNETPEERNKRLEGKKRYYLNKKSMLDQKNKTETSLEQETFNKLLAEALRELQIN